MVERRTKKDQRSKKLTWDVQLADVLIVITQDKNITTLTINSK
jgi:hypothetical protein